MHPSLSCMQRGTPTQAAQRWAAAPDRALFSTGNLECPAAWMLVKRPEADGAGFGRCPDGMGAVDAGDVPVAGHRHRDPGRGLARRAWWSDGRRG